MTVEDDTGWGFGGINCSGSVIPGETVSDFDGKLCESISGLLCWVLSDGVRLEALLSESVF